MEKKHLEFLTAAVILTLAAVLHPGLDRAISLSDAESLDSTTGKHLASASSGETEPSIQSTSQVNLQKGLVGYWRMDNVKASRGYSLEFDGSDDALRRNPFEIPRENLTISLWLKGYQKSGSQYIFSYAVSGSANHFLLGEEGDFYVSGTQHTFNISSLDDGKWHNVVVSVSVNKSQKIYIDGKLADEVAINESPMTSGGSMVLGQDQDSVGGSFATGQAFRGMIDQVKIFNETLNASQVDKIYENTYEPTDLIFSHRLDEGPENCDLTLSKECLEDNSGHNRDLESLNFNDNKLTTDSGWVRETPINQPSAFSYSNNSLKGFLRGGNNGQLKNFNFSSYSVWKEGRIGLNALRFNGTDQVKLSEHPEFEGGFTLTLWVYHDGSDWSNWQNYFNNGEVFIRKDSGGEGHLVSGFIVHNDSQAGGSDSWLRINGNSDDALEKNKWYHIALSWNGSRTRLYQNGKKIASRHWDKTLIPESMNDASPQIGRGERQNDGSHGMNGRIDDLRIYNHQLSTEQIKSIYRGESIKPVPANRWNFEAGDLKTAYDTAGSSATGILGTQATSFQTLGKRLSVLDRPELDFRNSFSISAWIKPQKSSVFFEGFESGTMKAPWNNVDDWRIYPGGWKLDVSAHDGHCTVPCNGEGGDPGVVSAADKPDYYFINDIRNGTYALYLRNSITATLPKLDLSGASSGTISGYWKGASHDGQGEHTSLEVYDGSSWIKINCIEGSNDGVINNSLCSAEDDGNWHHFQNNITPYLNKDFKIQFTGSPGSYDYSLIDNIKIKAPGAEISSFSPAIIKGGNGDYGTYSIWASPGKVFAALGSPTETWNKTNETGIYADTTKGWKNIVLTFQDSKDEVKLYVDGQLRNTTRKVGEIPVSSQELRINHRFKGRIDEVRIYNRTLTQEEIQKLNFG
ncbi:MAG: LamG-like jellyroll fold domain-containing protein [Candidatus Nanohalobium sp.]